MDNEQRTPNPAPGGDRPSRFSSGPIVDRSGPHHAPRFTISVTIGKLASATGEGTSKQEAETAAATALLGQLSRTRSG